MRRVSVSVGWEVVGHNRSCCHNPDLWGQIWINIPQCRSRAICHFPTLVEKQSVIFLPPIEIDKKLIQRGCGVLFCIRILCFSSEEAVKEEDSLSTPVTSVTQPRSSETHDDRSLGTEHTRVEQWRFCSKNVRLPGIDSPLG